MTSEKIFSTIVKVSQPIAQASKQQRESAKCRFLFGLQGKPELRAFTAVELKSYNAILAPLIYQKHLAAVVVKQKFFADLLQCTSIYRCAL